MHAASRFRARATFAALLPACAAAGPAGPGGGQAEIASEAHAGGGQVEIASEAHAVPEAEVEALQRRVAADPADLPAHAALATALFGRQVGGVGWLWGQPAEGAARSFHPLPRALHVVQPCRASQNPPRPGDAPDVGRGGNSGAARGPRPLSGGGPRLAGDERGR